MIEIPAARARDMRVDGVKDLPSLLVGVESLVDEMAQKTSALRNAESVGAFRRRHGFWIVLAVRHEIANGRQTTSDDRWIFRGVDDFVDFSGNESAVEMHLGRTREPPVAARYR